MTKKLKTTEVEQHLANNLIGWTLKGNFITKEYKFKSFSIAFAFMTAIAIEADKMNHHPNWENVYNRVNVSLQTHDVGGITQLDIDLAIKMESVYGRFD